MTTIADIVAEAQRLLASGSRIETNSLDSALDDSSTAVSFSSATGGIHTGSVLCIGIELLLVQSVDSSAKTAVVARGALGSTAAAHDAGATVEVNPKFSTFDVFRAVCHEVDDLASPLSGLFVMRTADFTFASNRETYDFNPTGPYLSTYQVLWRPRGGSRPAWRRLKHFRVERALDGLAEFPHSYGLMLSEFPEPGCSMRLYYRAGFATPTALTDTAASLGLPETAVDIPALGAAARLVASREVKRSFTEAQGEARRAEEVPAGAQVASARALLNLRAQRLAAEVSRLQVQWPLQGW